MSTSFKAVAGHVAGSQAGLVESLEHARSRLEDRFLEGGAVLAAALESVSDMISSLDQITAALGQDTVDATVADLAATTRQLVLLPELHTERQRGMRNLWSLGGTLKTHVDEMLETLRYLRTFAVTVKITGAGAAEFAGFADEMLDKIQSGRDQVDDFDARLGALMEQLREACSFGDDLQRQYDGVVPGVTRNLDKDAARMSAYHADVRRVAHELAELVRQVQGKVARVLSALQIGDMTRQRIEHVQFGLDLLAQAGPAAGEGMTLRLLAAQMEDLLDEFKEGCSTVTSSLAGLAGDTKEVIALGRQARGTSDGGNFLKALETSVTAARTLVGRVESAGQRTDEVSGSAASIAHELSQAVDSIRSIRSEIQYMTINTSLRCSRMGDAGKPMNVVASELRVFAEQMEVVSARILERLDAIGAAAQEQVGKQGLSGLSLGEALDNALAKIRAAGSRMESDLKNLSAKGDHVAREVGRGVSRLDFTRELGEVLEHCTLALADRAVAAQDDAENEGSSALAEKIFAKYTMARERQIHRAFFPAEAAVVLAVANPASDDDDEDLDAALF